MRVEKTPCFKEKDKEQFKFVNDEWVKTNEYEINLLWHDWVITKGVYREYDKENFLVYGYLKKNLQKITISQDNERILVLIAIFIFWILFYLIITI